MLAGLGIDILEVARMDRELQREGYGMRDSVFTLREVSASERTRGPGRHLASCFAAKEALLKALGTGPDDGLRWKEMELLGTVGAARSELVLSGKVREAADRAGVGKVWASISHTARLVIASVVLEAQQSSHPME